MRQPWARWLAGCAGWLAGRASTLPAACSCVPVQDRMYPTVPCQLALGPGGAGVRVATTPPSTCPQPSRVLLHLPACPLLCSTAVICATGPTDRLNPLGPYTVDCEGTKNLVAAAKQQVRAAGGKGG